MTKGQLVNVYVMFKGGAKKMESLWQAIVGTWRMLTTQLGHIRVDFAQPFSLQVCQGVIKSVMKFYFLINRIGIFSDMHNL